MDTRCLFKSPTMSAAYFLAGFGFAFVLNKTVLSPTGSLQGSSYLRSKVAYNKRVHGLAEKTRHEIDLRLQKSGFELE